MGFHFKNAAWTNIVLGLFSFSFQLTLMIGYKNDYSRPYQAGVWTGLLYVGSGLYALRSVRESTSSNQKCWLRLSMWLSLASVVASSVMIVFSGIAIHAWNWVSWEWFDVAVIRTLNSFLIVFGLIAIP